MLDIVLRLVQHEDELFMYDNIKTYGCFCMPIIIDLYYLRGTIVNEAIPLNKIQLWK